ncbi:MAG: cytochrome c1 [Proteobacteria bacterium]|nr:cytochrome c1 [Pseudomonadota bacterium]
MKRLFGIVMFVLSFSGQAMESAVPMEDADVDVFDVSSVRRGAAFYANYCAGCHSIKHLRYSRIAKDLEVSEEDLRKDIMIGGAAIHESMISGMAKVDGTNWFGVDPPDLSLVSRARGADWLYNYLKGFYVDPSAPTGVNNVVFPNVGMPNVLWELQGLQQPVYKKEAGAGSVVERLQLAQPGSMSSKEFDQAMTDLVNFLVYAGEPSQYDRLRLGKYVIFALLLMVVLFYKLKKEYWKDID